jgi:hypothetical protein
LPAKARNPMKGASAARRIDYHDGPSAPAANSLIPSVNGNCLVTGVLAPPLYAAVVTDSDDAFAVA